MHSDVYLSSLPSSHFTVFNPNATNFDPKFFSSNAFSIANDIFQWTKTFSFKIQTLRAVQIQINVHNVTRILILVFNFLHLSRMFVYIEAIALVREGCFKTIVWFTKRTNILFSCNSPYCSIYYFAFIFWCITYDI